MLKKQILTIAGIAIILIGFSITLVSQNFQMDSPKLQIMNTGNPRAAIIDQLDEEIPNKEFHEKITNYLTNAGYDVDLYTTEKVTVDLYKNLPSMDYKLIIIRSHSLGDGYIEESSSLFTGEKYSDHKYIKEQFLGYVGRAVPILMQEVNRGGGLEHFRNNTYFTVGSKMVDELMVGKFDNSVIILGGCETMQESRLADSFLKRGAMEVVGWSGLIDAQNNDNIMIEIVRQTTENKTKLDQTIDNVNENIKGRLYYEDTKLNYISRSI
ncbi:MAG TPA: hypothetical protein VD731_07585 [Nitrosopumilaceae archaeon]|nr:hypothetical protein [Nitrosopumilaceae archaeon]